MCAQRQHHPLLPPATNAWIFPPTSTAASCRRQRQPLQIAHRLSSSGSKRQRVAPLLRSRGVDDGEAQDDDDDDDEPPSIDVADFVPPKTVSSFGLNKGRSSPSQRKAMGRSGSSVAKIHVCTSCGSEFVKWMGRCPTCREWNTIQEHVVARQQQPTGVGGTGQPFFGGGNVGSHRPSWLDGIAPDIGYGGTVIGSTPIRISELYNATAGDREDGDGGAKRRRRIEIPDDFELNTVLGGGIMRGSLTLVGGDPGVGKSTLLLQTAGSLASLAVPTPGIGMGQPAVDKLRADLDLGPVWYVSGEENPEQIASRAARLGIGESELYLLSETHADSLCEQVAAQLRPFSASSLASPIFDDDSEDYGSDDKAFSAQFPKKPPSLIVIDSIQTMVCNAGGASSSGGVTQVRECVALFLRLAKSTGIAGKHKRLCDSFIALISLFSPLPLLGVLKFHCLAFSVMLVGHVTKTGDVAGPRTVEHMVDCVLYLEGVDDHGGNGNIRMLRASKNRFGSCEEVGVYEMTAGRLLPVSDPSSLFLSNRITDDDSEGCAVAIALEGRRAMTVEIQALVTTAGGNSGYGRRTVNGVDYSRLILLLGVLQKRCRIFLTRQDVYVNVVGRMRLNRGEGNAADLAVAVSLVSSLESIPVRADTAFVGEVGLLGELRPVEAVQKRLTEARRMGFSRVITPREARRSRRMKAGRGQERHKMTASVVDGVEWIQCETLLDAINAGLVSAIPEKPRRRTTKRSAGASSSYHEGSGEAPGTLQELELEEIYDDEGDEDSFL